MGGKRTPLQDVETLYIGGAEPVIVRRVRAAVTGLKVMRDCKKEFTTTMARTS
jgi:hypothetical protein